MWLFMASLMKWSTGVRCERRWYLASPFMESIYQQFPRYLVLIIMLLLTYTTIITTNNNIVHYILLLSFLLLWCFFTFAYWQFSFVSREWTTASYISWMLTEMTRRLSCICRVWEVVNTKNNNELINLDMVAVNEEVITWYISFCYALTAQVHISK